MERRNLDQKLKVARCNAELCASLKEKTNTQSFTLGKIADFSSWEINGNESLFTLENKKIDRKKYIDNSKQKPKATLIWEQSSALAILGLFRFCWKVAYFLLQAFCFQKTLMLLWPSFWSLFSSSGKFCSFPKNQHWHIILQVRAEKNVNMWESFAQKKGSILQKFCRKMFKIPEERKKSAFSPANLTVNEMS